MSNGSGLVTNGTATGYFSKPTEEEKKPGRPKKKGITAIEGD